MKDVKIFGNDGNTVFTDLDVNEHSSPISSNVVYVTFGETTKDEIIEHISNKDFMVCLAHTTDRAESYIAPMNCMLNYTHPGEEVIYFKTHDIADTVKTFVYTVSTDTWLEQ